MAFTRVTLSCMAMALLVACSNSSSDKPVQRLAFTEPVATPLSGNVTGSDVQTNLQSFGDLDGDGRSDVVIYSYVPGLGAAKSVTTYLANADGTFRNAGASPYFRAIADLNRDGKPDLLACGDALRVSLGAGDGRTWTEVSSIPAKTCTFIVADFDGDGAADIVADMEGQSSARRLELWRGLGDGRFAFASSIALDGVPASAFLELKSGDFNGDRRADLVVIPYVVENGRPQPQRVRVLVSAGDGRFTTTWPAGAEPAEWAGNSVSNVLVADLDRDGRSDLFVTLVTSIYVPPGIPSIETGTVSYFALLGQADGSVIARRLADLPAPPRALSDLDGDGIPDLAFWQQSTSSGGTLRVAYGRGDGTFSEAAVAASPLIGEHAWFVSVGDVDGDSRPDVLLTTPTRLLALLSR